MASSALTSERAAAELRSLRGVTAKLDIEMRMGHLLLDMSARVLAVDKADGGVLSGAQVSELSDAMTKASKTVQDLEQLVQYLGYAEKYLEERADGRYN